MAYLVEIKLIGFVLYFLPTIVGLLLRRPNRLALFLFNPFLGWSGVGWLAS